MATAFQKANYILRDRGFRPSNSSKGAAISLINLGIISAKWRYLKYSKGDEVLSRHQDELDKALNGGDNFYDSWEWKNLRYKVLKHYGPKCMCCGSTDKIVVDHIKPRRKYPKLELDFNNMQVMCNSCNMGKSNWDETDWRPKESPA